MWTSGSWQRWAEGPALLLLVCLGTVANVFSLVVIRNRELNLIPNFSILLQLQASYDLLYLLANLPAFVWPALVDEADFEHHGLDAMPFVLTLIQIFLTGSSFTTVALATERYRAMRRPKTERQREQEARFPTTQVVRVIVLASVIVNVAKMCERQVEEYKETHVLKLNDTGIAHLDHGLVTTHRRRLGYSRHLGSGYFLVSHALNFLVVVLVPSVLLIVLNALIYKRLQRFKAQSLRLGKQERKTIRATVSLIAIVILFLVCHSVKIVVNGFQAIQMVTHGALLHTWPSWVETLTVLSHVLLAFNCSINLLLYCMCDRHFWVIAQKKLRMICVYPLTLRSEFASLESVTISAHKETHCTTTEL